MVLSASLIRTPLAYAKKVTHENSIPRAPAPAEVSHNDSKS